MVDTGSPTLKASELLALKERYLLPCVYHFYTRPPAIVGGDGVYLFDNTGMRYLDGFSGVTVMSAGHCEEAILEPVIEQMRTLQHTTSIYLTEPVLRLAELLASVTPGVLCRSFFCASGSEAVEGALLLAALHTGRRNVVAMNGGLHGRTRWGMNVTGIEMWRTDPDPIPGVAHVPFGDLNALEQLLATEGEQFAALIAEPIQGNGGVRVPDDNYWPAVRKLCDRYGILLVFDEIQTGFNRTGRWFGCEHWEVVPDIMAVSKAMGNGFPIAALITTDEIAASYTRPGASTYGGNPVCAAAAMATIQFHMDRDLGANALIRGVELRHGLQSLARHSEHFGEPRGVGLMMGCPISDGLGRPDPHQTEILLESLKDHGLLAGKTGEDRNVLTFMPPLTVTGPDVELLLELVGRGVDDVF